MKTIVRCFFTIIPFLLLSSFYFGDDKDFDEQYRPQFHFSPVENRLTEPNGLVYNDGEYHLFYQYIINETDSLWGHAVSTDLVHWQHLPTVLPSGGSAENSDQCGILAGSVIVDQENLLEKQTGSDKTMVAFYTTAECGQEAAYSTDRGRTWRKLETKPSIPLSDNAIAKYPKVFWHEPTQKFVMALSTENNDDQPTIGISFYTSDNLIDWTSESEIQGFSGRFDLVELEVANEPGETKWVLFDGDGSYSVGEFDGKSFTSETTKLVSDWGENYYAATTWNNTGGEDSRTLQIAWMRGGSYPEMPFEGQMTFPSELSLENLKDGYRLVKKPVSELELLHVKDYDWEDENLIPGLNKNLIKRVKGDCLQIVGEFDLKTCRTFGFMIRTDRNNRGSEISYSVPRGVLSVLGSEVPLQSVNNKINLEILMDRTSVEVYANNGQVVVSKCFTPADKADEIELFNMGGELFVEKLEIFELESAWQEQ